MVDEESRHIDAGACPKQAWVMTALSSDDAWDANGELPQGLRFHLSQCARCRALADSMIAVTDALGALSEREPPGNLGDRANGQLAEALDRGARLTGRIEIPDELEVPAPSAPLVWPRKLVRFALAASIVLVAGLLWLRPFADRPQPILNPQHLADAPATIELVVEADPETEPPLPPGEGRGEGQTPGEGRGEGETVLVNAEPDVDKSIVEADQESSPARRRRRPICRDRSYIEAALSEDVDCIPRAIVLPDPAERARWIRTRTIDRPAHPVSTTDRPDPR